MLQQFTAEACCGVAVELWCELWGQRRGIYSVSVRTAAGRQPWRSV